MTCESALPLLTGRRDGELPPDLADEVREHLADCDACAAADAGLAGVLALADAWVCDAPDIAAATLAALDADERDGLLDEMRRMRAEMRALRDELAALRRALPPPTLPAPRPAAGWTPAARPAHARQETDPWNLTRF